MEEMNIITVIPREVKLKKNRRFYEPIELEAFLSVIENNGENLHVADRGTDFYALMIGDKKCYILKEDCEVVG
jgi:hypothetical protein